MFGASLGGFLAQKFYEEVNKYVASLLIVNSFSDTSIFYRTDTAPLYVIAFFIILFKAQKEKRFINF